MDISGWVFPEESAQEAFRLALAVDLRRVEQPDARIQGRPEGFPQVLFVITLAVSPDPAFSPCPSAQAHFQLAQKAHGFSSFRKAGFFPGGAWIGAAQSGRR